jgi:DNA polymerase-3 subunit delta
VKSNLTHYKKIFNDIEARDIVNLYLLEGPESFIMEEMAGRIVAAVVPDDLRAFNLTVSYGGDVEVGDFLTAASSFPFLSDYRVLVMRELEKLRGSWKRLIEYCEAPASTSIVILQFNPFDDAKGRSRSPRDFAKLEAAVRTSGKVIAFERLKGDELRVWVKQKAKRLGIELDTEAAEALMQSVGESLFDLQNEMTKLSLLFEGRTVRVGDLAAVIGRYRLNAVFELIDRIGPGCEADAVGMVERILRSGAERPAGIVYQLTRYFLALLRAKAGTAAEGYRGDRLKSKAQRFTIRELIVWLENLRRAELLFKTSSFPAEALLVGVLIHGCKGELLDVPLMAA